jgi:hypothetical protein
MLGSDRPLWYVWSGRWAGPVILRDPDQIVARSDRRRISRIATRGTVAARS